MTPDELRRMDNDLCIIFEKGIKPIQAEKFYYFQTSMAKRLAAVSINHNDIGDIERGIWRKYNPYNPYVEENKEKQIEDLKVESLDDLFEEETQEMQEAPILPQEENKVEEELQIDIQEELEAKFDELFGPIEDNQT